MKIQIHAPWEVNAYLEGIIRDKLEKLTKLDDRIIHAEVFLKMGAGKDIKDKEVEVRLRLPGPEIFAVADADTFEKAVAANFQKLRRQVRKRKEIRTSH